MRCVFPPILGARGPLQLTPQRALHVQPSSAVRLLRDRIDTQTPGCSHPCNNSRERPSTGDYYVDESHQACVDPTACPPLPCWRSSKQNC